MGSIRMKKTSNKPPKVLNNERMNAVYFSKPVTLLVLLFENYCYQSKYYNVQPQSIMCSMNLIITRKVQMHPSTIKLQSKRKMFIGLYNFVQNKLL